MKKNNNILKHLGGGAYLVDENKFRPLYHTLIILVSVCLILATALTFLLKDRVGADAFKNNTTPVSVGSITLAEYENRNDNVVFDGDVLGKVYDKILGATNSTYKQLYDKVNNSTSIVKGRVANSTQPHSMDYAEISGGTASGTANKTSAPSPVTVEIAGLKWNIVYLTTNTTSRSDGTKPDLIATLWLSETLKSSGTTESVYRWNDYSSSNVTTAYPSNMYSTSKIRVQTLNGGGDAGVNYASSNTARTGTVSQSAREANVFARYSLSKNTGIGKKSLTEYLVAPKDVLYQEKETFTWGFLSSGYHNLNEAWGTPDSGSYYSNLGQIAQKPAYLEWINDTIWLPSMTETGFIGGAASLWGIPTGTASQAGIVISGNGSNSYNLALRSGYQQGAGNAQCVPADGSGANSSVTNNFAIRPAIHLNLTVAEKSSVHKMPTPSNVSVTYNGGNQDIAGMAQAELPSWYDAAIYGNASDIAITYTDSTGSAVTPKDAGTYKAKIEIKTPSYEWSNSPNTGNGENATTRIIDFTINKKKLPILKFEDTDGDNIPDKVTGDSTALCAGDSMPTLGLIYGGSAGTGTTTKPTSAGTYYATAQITDTVSNYEIDATGSSHYKQFIVKAGVAEPYFASGSAGTVTATGQYTGNGIDFALGGFQGITDGDVTIVPQGAGITYNGADKKLVVTGGVGTYTAKAKLNDPTHKQWSGGNSADITLTVTITKGDYDFSKVKWQYQNASGVWTDYPASGIMYTGNAIVLRATGLPAGLTVLSTAYTDNSKTDVGKYTAAVTAITGLDTTNFNAVTVGNVSGLSQAWEIVKKEIALTWSTSTETVGGNTVMIPSLPTDAAYEVKYYAASDWDTALNAPKAGATALGLGDLTLDPTSQTTYYARAELNAYPYAGNYAFNGQDYQQFAIGGGKTGVLVTLNNGTKVYDSIPYAPNVTVTLTDGTPASVNMAYRYYGSDGMTELTGGAPTNAGEYYVEVEVSPSSSGFAVSGTSKFKFEIEKATYDLSGLQWTDGTNTYGLNDQISFVYDGESKTLSLSGLSGIVSAGSVKFNVALGGDTSKKDAGTHTITLTVTEDTDNYNPSGMPASVTWTITALAVDLSGIEWNYDASAPYVYERDETGAKEFSVAPLLPSGLPDELVDVIEGSYGGQYCGTEKGTYNATAGIVAALQNNADIQNNYILTYPTDFPPTLNWKIEERTFDALAYDNVWTVYDGSVEGHDLAKALGLPEDWINYFDVSIKLTRPDGTEEEYAGYEGKAHLGNDAGKYAITFTVKSGINPASGDANVWLGDDETATVEVEIAQRKLTVNGWRGAGTKAQAQFAEEDVLSAWYKYAVYDSEGNIAEPDAVTGKYAAGTYRRTVEPTSGNVVIEFTAEDSVVFTVTADGNETDADVEKIDAPTFKGGMGYTGKEFTITDENAGEYFDGWDSEKMTVVTCETGKDAGEYKVTVGLKDTLLTAWSDDETSEPKEIVWEIEKAKLTVTWENEKDPVANAGEYEGMVEFEYAYYEGDTEVPRESLEAGKSYTVKATLKEGYEKNFEFTDAEGNVLEEPTESEGYGFVKGSDSWLGQLCERIGLPYNFPLIQVLLTCLFTLLFILFLTLWIVYAKRRRAAQAEIEEYKEIMGE